MPITLEQIAEAARSQDLAAKDPNGTIRLIAGPGTGKSFVIEGRVKWLLSAQGVDGSQISAVSFTRAAAKDLERRIYGFCEKHGLAGFEKVRVSTLHSLALYTLKKTGNLNAYPVDPIVMDTWESERIFDAEFANSINCTPGRASEIRLDHEAYWCTGEWNPPNHPQLDEPITEIERESFKSFHTQRTQLYSAVLPGEVIRRCVELIDLEFIDLSETLGLSHLIVDEAQDLNPCDFEFINQFILSGTNTFLSGDDDQSVYSFRHAFPQGIQEFIVKHPTSTDHILNDCFRCTPQILNAAKRLLASNQAPNRIPKNLISLYENSMPKNNGHIVGKKFASPQKESSYIANSCRKLIESGIDAGDIMVLLGNKRVLLKDLRNAFDEIELNFEIAESEEFTESDHGRFLISLLNLLKNPDNYLAYRVLLGTPRGIGITTCKAISDKVLLNNMNFKNLFVNEIPKDVFGVREMKAIDRVKTCLSAVQFWKLDNSISDLRSEVDELLTEHFSDQALASWESFISDLPDETTAEEILQLLESSSQESKVAILKSIGERLGLIEEAAPILNNVRFSTFHSSKGLDAKVVFIPGLEETVFPTVRSGGIAGLVLENARLLYVAITRAKASCVLSYSTSRTINGKFIRMEHSRFCEDLRIPFGFENNPELIDGEVDEIRKCISNLGVERL